MKQFIIIGILCGVAFAQWEQQCGNSLLINNPCDQPLPLKIVGGIQAQGGEIPWQVAMVSSSNDAASSSQFCGGSVLNHDYVITAAHCTNGQIASGINVVAGRTTVGDSTQVIRSVSAIHQHANYEAVGTRNDISLLKLAAPLSFDDYVQPVCEPDAGFTYDRLPACITGWGTLQSGGAILPATLRTATVIVDTQAVCQAAYGQGALGNEKIDDGMICSSINGVRDACQGDSGGPMVYFTGQSDHTGAELIGLTSWGNGCALDGYPGVYTRVTYFLGWITDNAV